MAEARRRHCDSSPSTPTRPTSSARPRASPASTAILAEHCAAVGRDPDEIERSTLQNVTISTDGSGGTETPSRVIERFGELSDAGAQHVIISMRQLPDLAALELVGREVIPQLHDLP